MLQTPRYSGRLVLNARTAADLMSNNPISLRAQATVAEAVATLTDRGYGAAPVIDEAGRPVGVLSRADLLIHDRERLTHPANAREYPLPEGFGLEEVDGTLVEDLMTPAVFSVTPATPVETVVEQMLALQVHHLYVVDQSGALVGVISGMDIVRHLKPER
jgi:CBS domain-containing protein